MNPNPNYETPLGMICESRRDGPQFPPMEEMEKWFDQNYCGIERLAIIAPPPAPGSPMAREHSQQRMSQIAEVAAPLRVRKSEWLRRDGNEEWYGPRLALVQAVWNRLKYEHEIALNYQSDKARKLDQELGKAKEQLKELDAEFRALAEKKEAQCRDLGVVRNAIAGHVVVLRDRHANKKKSLPVAGVKELLKNFKSLLNFELK